MKKKKKINYEKEYIKIARQLLKIKSDMKEEYSFNSGMESERRRVGNDDGAKLCESRRTILSYYIPDLEKTIKEMFDIIENRGENYGSNNL